MNDTPSIQNPMFITERYDTHVANPWVQENRFFSVQPERMELPLYSQARQVLPDPFWASHAATIACY